MSNDPKPTIRALQGGRLPRYRGQSLPVALLRAREALMVHFRPMLARHDLTEQQWRVIRVLAEIGPADASTLAQEAFILAPSLTRILRSLEERELVRRTRDERDGRRILLAVTPRARALIDEIVPESLAIYAMIEQGFGGERMVALLRLLDELQVINAPTGGRTSADGQPIDRAEPIGQA